MLVTDELIQLHGMELCLYEPKSQLQDNNQNTSFRDIDSLQIDCFIKVKHTQKSINNF